MSWTMGVLFLLDELILTLPCREMRLLLAPAVPGLKANGQRCLTRCPILFAAIMMKLMVPLRR